MYVPASFEVSDPAKLRDFMRRHGFATLITRGKAGMTASHLPLLLDAEAGPHGHILGHMARANPQWREIEDEALVIFPGPHVYVSPSWYESRGTVPTWNYATVHAYGPIQLVEDRDGLVDILRRMVTTYESPRPEPWRFDDSEPGVEAMLKAIVGFRIEIRRIEGKWKLNQNQPEERRRKVVRALEAQPDDDSRAIARLMSETLGS